MNFIECPQGTDAWLAARCGKITASCFADAISTVGGLTEQQAKYVELMRAGGTTPKHAAEAAGYKVVPSSDIVRRALAGEDTCEPSDIAKRYAADLAIDRISGQPHGEPPKAWVLERGHKMEAAARMHYEARTGSFVTEAGICVDHDGIFGYSTDGLVDDDGLIEIKAPVDSSKILTVWQTGDTSEYDHQMQGGMWITGRKWCDFIMYVPDLAAVGKDLYVKRVFRDDAFIDAMVARLAKFDSMVKMFEGVFRCPVEGAVDAELNPDFQEVHSSTPATVTSIDAVRQATPAADLGGPQTVDRGAPTLRLGQINERLAPVALTAEGLTRLGFAPAATDKAAKLYYEQDFPAMCAALIRHIGAVQSKLAA